MWRRNEKCIAMQNDFLHRAPGLKRPNFRQPRYISYLVLKVCTAVDVKDTYLWEDM